MEIEELKYKLKEMIIQECEKEDITPDDIANDVELFSKKSGLELDSLDALQISMGIQNNYGIRLADPKDFRRIVTTIDKLASYIQSQK
ncbi:acyl carrier protein [Sulfurimonas sp.]|uniref:acyl carrier protein n=1 Tax=Sulfurimonas sp. TaxID=2022749 RepID=UPI002AB1E4B9|nr:acyl carrier protein [Sulfurimonas sp.]